MSRPAVLIAGGGFAGLACALALDSDQYAVTLVDQRRHFEFIPNIHELISGAKRPANLRLPLGPILRSAGHRFRLGRIGNIDTGECSTGGCSLTLEDGRSLHADYLVIATGSVDADYGVAGVAKHCLALKSVADGEAIHRRLAGLKRSGTTARVVIAGAGLAGVEALGEVLRYLPREQRDVHLVEAAGRLLPAGPEKVSAHLRRACEGAGVTLHLGDPVARVTAKTVLLAGGQRLRSDATLWTGGPAPPPVLAASRVSVAGRWADVDADLSLRGHDNVFVAGDSAELPQPLSRQAYFALDMGAAVAGNIDRRSRGKRTRSFRALPRPTLMSFGEANCILIAGPRAVAAPALAAGKEAIYTAVMAQLDQRDPGPRVRGLIERGRNSTALLWPVLRPRELLRGAARVRAL